MVRNLLSGIFAHVFVLRHHPTEGKFLTIQAEYSQTHERIGGPEEGGRDHVISTIS